MSEHAELSPSAADRWLNCTASVAFCAGVVEEESEYAREGTIAHEKLELWLTLGVPPVDGELYYNLLPTYNAALKLEEDGYDVSYEVCVAYSDRIWGTADILATKRRTLRIDDYKHGYNPVNVKRNAQLLTYVVCAEKQLGLEFNDIRVAIHQPRIPHIDGTIRYFDVSRDLLDWHENELHSAIRAIDNGEGVFMAGKWCRYCPRLGDCRKGVNFVATMLTGRPLL